MEIELKLPQAEQYIMDFPRLERRKQSLDAYVRQSLMELHPGFGEESIWDYKVLKKDSIKKIFIIVIQRDYYLEKRLGEKRTEFFTYDEEGNKIKLFKQYAFDENGNRRQRGLVFIILLLIILCACGIWIIINAQKNGKKTVVLQVQQEEIIQDALNVFKVMYQCARIIEEHGAKVKLVQFNASDKGRLLFSMSGCEPYSLVCDLEKEDQITNCACNSISYINGIENFDISIDIKLNQILQKKISQTELLKLQNHIIQELQKHKMILVSSGVESGSGRVSVQIESEINELGKINEAINRLCIEENLFVSGFSEIKNDGNNLVILKADFIGLEQKQKLQKSREEEKLSKVFEKQSNAILQENQQNQKQKTLPKDETETRKLKKIGSVKKEGKDFFYYRTADGKIIISEENYE